MKRNLIILCIFSAMMLDACHDEENTKVTCLNNANCASRTDGLTECDTIIGQCVQPAYLPRCVSNNDCIQRTDGRTLCDESLKFCVEPGRSCSTMENCLGRTDGRTRCDKTLNLCVAPECYSDDDCITRDDDKIICDQSTLTCNYKSCTQHGDCTGGQNGRILCHPLLKACTRPECTNHSDCANNAAGKNRCDFITSLCASPITDLKCNSDLNCQIRDDDKKHCQISTKTCINPNDEIECSSDTDCANRSDGKTKCNTNAKKCFAENIYPPCSIFGDCSEENDICLRDLNICYDGNLDKLLQTYPYCNNGVIDRSAEYCDLDDFGANTCSSATDGQRPYGNLICTSNCTLNTRNCYECLSSGDCANKENGRTTCHPLTHVCYNEKTESRCGDGMINTPTEACDLYDFGSASCDKETNHTVKGGHLVCNSDCTISTTYCAECEKDSDCSLLLNSSNLYCNRTMQKCVECTRNEHCPSQLCLTYGYFGSFKCAECTEDAHCAGLGLKACNKILNKCVECQNDSHCTDPRANYCDTYSSKCVECTSDEGCANRNDFKTSCDIENNVCTYPSDYCNNDSDCQKNYPEIRCNRNTHKCVEYYIYGDNYTCGIPNGQTHFMAKVGESHQVKAQIYIQNCTTNHNWCDNIRSSSVYYYRKEDLEALGTFSYFDLIYKSDSVNAYPNTSFDFGGDAYNNNEYYANLKFDKPGTYHYLFTFDLSHDGHLQTVSCASNWIDINSDEFDLNRSMTLEEFLQHPSQQYSGIAIITE